MFVTEGSANPGLNSVSPLGLGERDESWVTTEVFGRHVHEAQRAFVFKPRVGTTLGLGGRHEKVKGEPQRGSVQGLGPGQMFGDGRNPVGVDWVAEVSGFSCPRVVPTLGLITQALWARCRALAWSNQKER